MSHIVLLALGFVFGGIVGMGVSAPSHQQIIDKFVDPVCVSDKVGADYIKKCYTIKEVSEL